MFSFLHTLPPGDLAVLLGSAFVAGMARGFSGFGGALIFVPLASAIVGPQVAAPLLLVIDGVAALGLVPKAWANADRRDVATMALGGILGIPAGTWLLSHSDPLVLRWGIALLIVALLALLVSGWRYRGRPTAPLTVGVGGIAGVLGGAAQVSGPPIIAYWLGGAGAPATVRANIVLYTFVSTLIVAVSYVFGGLWNPAVFGLALLVGPSYGGGLLAGSRLFGLADEAVFRRVCYGLIATAAVLSLPLLDPLLR